MSKYNTKVSRWIAWDTVDELNEELDHLKKDVLTDVMENVLPKTKVLKEGKGKKKSEEAHKE